MKKVGVALLSLLLMSIGCYAAENDVMEISAKDKVITITVTGELPEAGKLTMLVVKDGTSAFADRIYSVTEVKPEVGKTVTVQFEIPDFRRLTGETGSGDYTVYLNNKNGEILATQGFSYATDAVITGFITALKDKAAEVVDASLAYEKLNALMTSSNAGVFFSIGFDFDGYLAASVPVQQQTLNLIYSNGVGDLNLENLSNAFNGAFGLAYYNTGDHLTGIASLSPVYNGKKINAQDALMSGALASMDSSYPSVSAFRSGFMTAYGLETINTSNKYGMENTLAVFRTEIGECATEIQKLAELSPNAKNTAYEFMVSSIATTKLTSVTSLKSLLTAAYTAATSNPNQGGGGFTGGGGGGGGGAVSGKGSPVDIVIEDDDKEDTIVTTPTVEMVFTDLSIEHWAAEGVKWLKNQGIVNGTDAGSFEPNRTITREEFAKMLVLACGLEGTSKDTEFTDVESGAWYASYIAAAAENGIVNGVGNNQFGVGQQITRQDMAVMVKRALQQKGITLTGLKKYIAFADEASMADYARDAILALYEAGVINGKGENRFEPLGNATRAEAAKMIYEAFKGGI
ncbi:MAG: S-layer homology domain-containing protein [Clostridia bacterium]|nr:S-layer homology domain-containing protein [Clostridia bacterium]